LFGWDSRPENATDEQWPPLAEVVLKLRAQHVRLRRVFEELSPMRLATRLNLPAWGWHGSPLRRVIIHALHDEACHSGEIWLLRKLLKQRR
jgi:hypothetical protein